MQAQSVTSQIMRRPTEDVRLPNRHGLVKVLVENGIRLSEPKYLDPAEDMGVSIWATCGTKRSGRPKKFDRTLGRETELDIQKIRGY